MVTDEKTLSAPECAVLCGVSRATVNYWIRKKNLYAKRSARNYSIPVRDLLHFLRSTGRDIPPKLKRDDFKGSIFKSLQRCWEYWKGHDRVQGCEGCVVFLKRLDVCFTAKINSRFHCNTVCNECHYYLETYLPRMHFIHQIDVPAAIYRDLYFWSGNISWADLCEVQERDLLGMGIEQVVHPDSLPIVISSIKNAALGDPDAPRSYSIFLNNRKHGKLKAKIAVYPLSEPSGTNLVLAEHEMG